MSGIWKKYIQNFDLEDASIITEGLITSYDPRLLRKELIIELKIPQKNIKVQKLNVVFFNFDLDISNDKTLKRLLNQNGYTLIKTSYNGLSQQYEYTIEPKFPSVLIQKPKVLYHITPTINLDKIKKIGLTPRTSKTSFNHEGNRIYLLATTNINDILKIGSALHRDKLSLLDPEDIERLDDAYSKYAILEITSMENATYYLDPSLQFGDVSNTCFGVFTLRNIHPNLIKAIGTYKF